MVKFHVPINDALHWKLNKGQTLHNAICNYANLELDIADSVEYDVYVQDGDFIVELEMGEK
jgi:hypothetical protein